MSVGIESKLRDEGFGTDDISRLCDLAETTPSLDGLLSVAPVKASREIIERIYVSSLRPVGTK
jgi:alcohol dehydrogenase class IV